MRLTRLQLERYGHLSDVDFSFDPAAGLQVVLGANEAGKSTALAAIGDALFGFPNKTAFGFLHDQKDLRVGVGVQAADGRAGFFVRRKGRQDTLRDEAGAPVPEAALAGFLAGAAREKFVEMFGMDGAELRRGGAAILEFKGEIGQSIVQAFAGRPNARGAVAKLNEMALALYGDRRGDRAFHIATDNFRRAKQDLEERSVRPAEYGKAVQARADCLAARAKNTEEQATLEVQRARLDRIRRTAPARFALLRYRAELSALGEVRPMPADAEERHSKAIFAREGFLRLREREVLAQAADEAALAALVVDGAVLAEAATIDALAADLNRIVGAAGDREKQIVAANQARALVEAAGRRLGLAGDATALVSHMPNDVVRAAALRAIKEHTQLSTRRQQAVEDRERAADAARAAQAALEACPAPAPDEAMVAAIEHAKAEGRIDADLAAAQDEAETARRALAAALATLPFWTGSADLLRATPLPLAAGIAGADAALAAAAERVEACRRDRAALLQDQSAIAADMAGVLSGGTPPTAEAIDTARRRRDRAWSLIRRQFLEAGAPPLPEEALGLPDDLGRGLAALIAEADALADRRVGEADRVARYEQLRAGAARTAARLEAAQAALAAATGQQGAAWETWVALWQPAGLLPGDPAAMREFATRRGTVLACLADMERKAAAEERLRLRHESAFLLLSSVTPVASATPEAVKAARGQIAPLLRAAERLRAQHDAARLRHTEAARALEMAERAMEGAETRGAGVDRKLVAWGESWAPIAAALGLPPVTGAESGADALGVWTELDRHARDWRAADARVAAMSADIDGFAGQVAACTLRCGADLGGQAAELAVRALAARLGRSREAARQRDVLVRQCADRATVLADLVRNIAGAEDTLAGLRTLAGAIDEAALESAIARARAAGELGRRIREREDELQKLDDGLSFEALAAEAEGEVLETLPARIQAIDARRREIAAENEESAKMLRDLETRLHAMEHGQDAAEAAQRMQDAAAEAQEIAARYVRLRLSHALLRAGIERFRKEQQAPLLDHAGALFSALTEGRYDRLGTDETEDAKMVVVALRPDGTHCPADRLSEGTRDQLFLALRLAAIRIHAAHTEPLPFIADDLLASFDDVRAAAALRVLAGFGGTAQCILFTHHAHVAAMAEGMGVHTYRMK